MTAFVEDVAIAVATHAFAVRTSVRMRAICGFLSAGRDMVTCITHSLCIVRPFCVFAFGSKSLLFYIIFSRFNFRAHFGLNLFFGNHFFGNQWYS